MTQNNILTKNNIDPSTVSKLIQNILQNSDGGELFIEHYESEQLELDDGIIKPISFHSHSGFGLRRFVKDVVAFYCSSDISESEIKKADNFINSIDISCISKIQHKSSNNQNNNLNRELLYTINTQINLSKKVSILQEIDNYIRSKSDMVKQVKASISGNMQNVTIVKRDGRIATDFRPLIRLNISVILEKSGRKENGSAGHGGRSEYIDFISESSWKKIADEAFRIAEINLNAIPAPAGEMTVVLGPGWPGVLLHEAIGHGLEADFNRKKVSIYSDSIGKQIANEGITIVDDGTIIGKRGSINIDDEGNTSNYNVLIDNGVLVGYMQDEMNALLMNSPITGNGRRQSYRDVVMPRMTNTYMLNGPHDVGEIISSVKNGIYAANFGGGQVDITSGKFVFSASEAYIIRNGKIEQPIKGATLIDNGPEVLKKISMVGNDLKIDPGVGTCSKNGQDLPVGVGQPSLKIDSITVGGTA